MNIVLKECEDVMTIRGEPRMEDISEQQTEINTPNNPEQNNHRRNVALATVAGLGLVGVTILGVRIFSGGEEAPEQPIATAVAGASPKPSTGNTEIPTHTAAPLTPNTATAIPNLPPTKTSTSKTPTSFPAQPTPKPTPSSVETATLPVTPEVLTPAGALVIPFVTDKPAERKGKSEQERIAMYEIPVENWPLDNQARKNEAMRAYKEYVSRLVAWRSYGNTTPWETLYNDPDPSFDPNNWPPKIAKESTNIFKQALTSDLLNGSGGKNTRQFYKEMEAIVAGDAEAYYHSVGQVYDEKNGASYNQGNQLWSTKGTYRSSYAVKFNYPEPIVQGADVNGNPYYRIDSELIDYNNAPQDPRVIQRTVATIDERAKSIGDGDSANFETFLHIGKGINGNNVWLITER